MSIFDKLKSTAGQAVNAAAQSLGSKRERFTFAALPESLAEMQALPEASLDTPFKTAALTVLALCAYAADKSIGTEMLNWLRGPRPLNGQDISFLNDRFRDGKTYLPFTYFAGSTPDNNYTPTQPYTITVEMVLVFLRLDSSTTDYVIRRHSLDDIVRPAVRRFAGEFIRRRLRLEYQPLDHTVVTDGKWLGFVVEQVLSNALKYTASGSVTISMDGDDLCIRDTGMGIAAEDLPRIFEQGFTGVNGRRDRRASGIGLYLCRRICGNLGHTIRASSVPNQGTEIRIGLGQKKTLPE